VFFHRDAKNTAIITLWSQTNDYTYENSVVGGTHSLKDAKGVIIVRNYYNSKEWGLDTDEILKGAIDNLYGNSEDEFIP